MEVGQWSLRGGIVDIFSPTHERPVRAEFFGDEVESLRVFDPTTQRSVEPLDGADRAAARAATRDADAGHPGRAYLPRDDAAWCSRIPRVLDAPPDDAPVGGAARLRCSSDFQRLELPLLGGPPRGRGVAMGTRSVGGYRGQFKTLAGRDPRTGAARASPCGSWWTTSGRRARLRQMLSEHELEAWPEATLWSPEGLGVLVGECAAGFQLPALGLVVLSRGGDLRRAAPAPPAAALPARRRHRLLHRPGRQRPRGARAARHRPLPRPPHAHVRAGATPTSSCSSTPTAAGSTCPSSGST